jgi:hypothetical protein
VNSGAPSLLHNSSSVTTPILVLRPDDSDIERIIEHLPRGHRGDRGDI